ncbi:MAG: efflux RND transporter periplasmic adaptor subunit [Deltaproteobacteria bacterium]|nr:MAG: efflux RND transporter periplasmic adaptor subunit [Deltaproteobacteria bacterium]
MKKRIVLAILGVLVVAAILAGVKAWQIGKMIDQGKAYVPPTETVTAYQVATQQWTGALTAIGSLTAVQGVTVAAEVPGKVVEIAFQPGSSVRRGDLLLRQDTSVEEAQLPGAEAAVVLARANFERARALLAEHAVARAEFDTAQATLSQAEATVAQLKAAIARKTVRAPFAGRLGIRLVNLGQILREGESIVSLQTLDPIFVDFALPQQSLSRLKTGIAVQATTDAWPGETFGGALTTINAEVDAATRNIRLQATLANPGEKLRPGMFVQARVVLPDTAEVLAIPSSAVLYAPYGDSVYVIEDRKDEQTGQTGKALRQQFVRLGEKRGDFVAVLSGLKASETVVSSGAFKLRNGQAVVVDNTLSPAFSLEPKPENN